MDPTLAVIACCALAPVGLGIAWLLGLAGKKDGKTGEANRGPAVPKRGWPPPLLGLSAWLERRRR